MFFFTFCGRNRWRKKGFCFCTLFLCQTNRIISLHLYEANFVSFPIFFAQRKTLLFQLFSILHKNQTIHLISLNTQLILVSVFCAYHKRASNKNIKCKARDANGTCDNERGHFLSFVANGFTRGACAFIRTVFYRLLISIFLFVRSLLFQHHPLYPLSLERNIEFL